MDPNILRLAMGAGGVSAGPKVYSWGFNNSGQLGLGNTTSISSPVQIGSLSEWSGVSAGNQFSLIVSSSGKAFSFGTNVWGRLGLGDTTNRSSPVQIGALTNWYKFGGGGSHRLAVKTNGTLWSWGSNWGGELGNGTSGAYYHTSSPAQIGSSTDWASVSNGTNNAFSLAVKTNGTLWAFGYNDVGQLGLSDTTNRSSPTQVGALTNWSKVAAGRKSSAAIKTDGTLWCWGRNNYGQIGDGTTTDRSSPVQIGTGTNWSNVSAGFYFTIAVKTDGTLWSWGSHRTVGALGLGNSTNYSSPKQIGSLTNWSSVSCGSGHTLALKTDGTLWGWGG